MAIGDLDKLVTLQYKTKVPDGLGGFTSTWVNSDSIWAAIWPVSASETVKAMQTTMTITHRIRIRWRAKVKPQWRLKFGERIFNIVSIINPNEDNRWLDIMAKEVQA